MPHTEASPEVGAQQAAQHFDGGRFPGPVGAEESADGAAGHFQREAIHRGESAEASCEVPAGNQ